MDARILEQITVDPATGCWLWQGRTDRDGYGLVYADGKTHRFHCYCWRQANGPVPDGHTLDHLKDERGPCRHRHCGNPAHLKPVPVAVNCALIVPWNRLKTHCPAGHAYTEHGVSRRRKDGYLRRDCRLCSQARNRAKKRTDQHTHGLTSKEGDLS